MLGKSKKRDDYGGDRKPVEQEVAELQRKFRVLENDKRAFSEDSQSIIRKQRASIEKLTRENRSMKQELTEVRRGDRGGPEARRGAETLARIAENKESLEKSIAKEYEIKLRLDEKIDVTEARTTSIREELGQRGGVGAAKDSTAAVQKQIRVLENRLDKSLQNFNQGVSINKNLRDKIDSLRRERTVFDQIYSKLEREFEAKKKEMATIIESANSAYEARDSAQAQMTSLKQQADREHSEFEREWKELSRLIDNDKKMKEYMRTKERERVQDAGKDATVKGDLSHEDEDRMKKKVTKNAWAIARGKVQLSGLGERISIYEEAFARIQAATGISDIDDLVLTFVNAEDSNFSLFNYANLLSTHIERLETEIGELKADHELLKSSSATGGGAGGDSKAVDKQKLLFDLEEKWNRADKRGEYYELRYQQSIKVLTAVRAGLQSIYNRLGCSETAQLGSSGVTESNMLNYLGVIEQRCNEILLLHSALQEGEGEGGATQEGQDGEGAGAGAATQGGVREPMSQLQIKLPSTIEDYTDDEDDDEEDDTRPFTREELRLKTQRALQRKHGHGGGSGGGSGGGGGNAAGGAAGKDKGKRR